MTPSYFFHLVLELYNSLGSIDGTPSTSEIYSPPPHTDIFKEPFPEHRKRHFDFESPARPTHKRSNTLSFETHGDYNLHHSDINPRGPQRARSNSQTGATNQTPRHRATALSKISTFNPTAQARRAVRSTRDWRFDRISIQSIDMKSREDGRARSKTIIGGGLAGGLATKGRFLPVDPKNTELGWGVVHLYRDANETPALDEDRFEKRSTRGNAALADSQDLADSDCTTLCILAVPSYLTPSDFLGWVGEGTRDAVTHFRMIRTDRFNRYMVLMKFRDAYSARSWRKEWNGKLFNSMEPENCHVVFVKSIRFNVSLKDGDPSSFPDISNDPFSPPHTDSSHTPSSPITASLGHSPLSKKPQAPPTASLVELPTCPVCLERMDETSGLLTILCQHVFHCDCLKKWRGSGCPVCRYTQNDALLGSDGSETDNQCSVCGSESNLWICLICGNVGCGRYDEAHAFSHYEETSHCYAMDIDTQRVWDYVGDAYVHRLIQNKSDGKLVELPGANERTRHPNNNFSSLQEDHIPREKLDNIGMEFTYLLTSQLESQRAYFEEKVERAADKAADAAKAAELATVTAQNANSTLKSLQASLDEISKDIMPQLEKEKVRAEKRAAKFEVMARKMEKDWKEEKTMNESLLERVALLNKELEALKISEKEARDTSRDVMAMLSGMEQIDKLGEDVQGASVSLGDAPKRKGKGKRG